MPTFDEKTFRIIFYSCYFALAFAIACAVLSAFFLSPGESSMMKTSISGSGDLDIREYAPGGVAGSTAMVAGAAATYVSFVECGKIVTFTNSFVVTGAQAAAGHRNQYVLKGSGKDNAFEYRATAITGDFVGRGELILRGSAPDENGVTTEARIKLDASGGKAIFDLDVINVSTGRPVTAFELDAVGNWTFQQYLQLNETQREALREENFCESLDRILPRDFSGYYIAPAGKKLTADADLVDAGANTSPIEVSASSGRFAEEQRLLDEYREAHPEEFEED
jgi:hypothetical protein